MKKIRNILSIALVFVMLIGFAPVNVFADNGNEPAAADVTPVDNTNVPAGQGQQADQAAEALKNAKKDAETKIKALAFLSDDVKNAVIAEINGDTVTTTDAVTEKLNAATTKNTEAEKTAKDKAKEDIKGLSKLTEDERNAAITKVNQATTPDAVKEVVTKAKTKNDAPAPKTYGISVYNAYNGKAKTNVTESEAGKTITVTADPAPGYVVDKIIVRDGKGNPLTLRNEKHKNYYNDYPYYPNSRWYRGYDYDDYIRWCSRNGYSRYDYSSFRTWCRRYGYNYDYDDFRRFYDWDDIYDYRWYNRYNYSYINQADFTMPDSAVTVEVTFTSAPYWYDGYFYDYETGTYRYYYDDDYYYYRNRRNKKSNYYERQAEKDKKEEETKVVEEKKNDTIVTKAVISIGSNMIDKVSNDLHTKRLMDAPAYVKDGRVMLPLRFVAEALGLQVSWIKDNRTVVIQDMLFRVEIPVDTNNITVNGVTTTSDVKPEIVNGRVMLPIANIARALGLVDGRDIVWNAATKEVTLTRTITK